MITISVAQERPNAGKATLSSIKSVVCTGIASGLDNAREIIIM